MSAIIDLLTGNLTTVLGGIVVAIMGIFAARQSGKKAEQRKQAAENVKAVEKANQAERDADASDDPASELRDDWQR